MVHVRTYRLCCFPLSLKGRASRRLLRRRNRPKQPAWNKRGRDGDGPSGRCRRDHLPHPAGNEVGPVHPEKPFTFTSGRSGPVYIDCRRLGALSMAEQCRATQATLAFTGQYVSADLPSPMTAAAARWSKWSIRRRPPPCTSVSRFDGMSAKGASSDVPLYAAVVANSTRSKIEGSSFSGLFTRVEIGHIRIGSAGYGRISKQSGLREQNRPGLIGFGAPITPAQQKRAVTRHTNAATIFNDPLTPHMSMAAT